MKKIYCFKVVSLSMFFAFVNPNLVFCQNRLTITNLLNICLGEEEDSFKGELSDLGYGRIGLSDFYRDRFGNNLNVTFSSKYNWRKVFYSCKPQFLSEVKKDILESSIYQMTDKDGWLHYVTFNGRFTLAYKYYGNEISIHIDLSKKEKEVIAYPMPGNKLYITSYTNATPIQIKAGDKVFLKATGEIVFGAWAGLGGPDGIDGFTSYNYVSGFRHGALLGKVGNGDWFIIGSEKSFIASTSGLLKLTVNDSAPNDNDRHFDVEYSIQR